MKRQAATCRRGGFSRRVFFLLLSSFLACTFPSAPSADARLWITRPDSLALAGNPSAVEDWLRTRHELRKRQMLEIAGRRGFSRQAKVLLGAPSSDSSSRLLSRFERSTNVLRQAGLTKLDTTPIDLGDSSDPAEDLAAEAMRLRSELEVRRLMELGRKNGFKPGRLLGGTLRPAPQYLPLEMQTLVQETHTLWSFFDIIEGGRYVYGDIDVIGITLDMALEPLKLEKELKLDALDAIALAHRIMSVAAVVDLDSMTFDAPRGVWHRQAVKLQDRYTLCSGFKFGQRWTNPAVVGTAVLVGRDTIATAAHIPKTGCWTPCVIGAPTESDCSFENIGFVFGYEMTPSSETIEIPASHVYKAANFVAVDRYGCGDDWAMLKLDREVPEATAVPIHPGGAQPGDSVYCLGYPEGMGLMRSVAKLELFSVASCRYWTSLDVFTGNSGAPVFNYQHELVGIHSRDNNGYEPLDRAGSCKVPKIHRVAAILENPVSFGSEESYVDGINHVLRQQSCGPSGPPVLPIAHIHNTVDGVFLLIGEVTLMLSAGADQDVPPGSIVLLLTPVPESTAYEWLQYPVHPGESWTIEMNDSSQLVMSRN